MLIVKKDYKKILAACLIFCFAFTNAFSILAGVSYAETNENTSKNVEYTATFKKGEEDKGQEYEGVIDEEDISIELDVEVKNEGYLKNAQILIESENGLSFEISQENRENYNIKENKVALSNISSGNKTTAILPIKYKEREDIENLNKKVNAKLIGIYVNNSGDEQSISENISLNLKWNTNTEFNITSELTKFIPYSTEKESGVIVQTAVKSWIPEKNNFTSKEELEIKGVSIDGYSTEKVVVSNKTGESIDSDNWKFDKENNKITIKTEKDSEVVETNEVLITYILSGKKEIKKPLKISSKINGSIFMFGTDEKSEYELEEEYEVEENIGKIVSIESESQEEIKIGKTLTNSLSNENEYKTTYKTDVKIDISSKEMIENVVVKSQDDEFENDEEAFKIDSSKVKTISILKENFEKILGKDGKIEIYNSKNKLIATINKDSKVENEKYTANIEEKNVVIKTSKPQEEGILVINIEKELNKTKYTYEQIKTFSKLNTNYSGSVIYAEKVENNIGTAKSTINLVKPQTNAELTISRTSLSTIAENNDIELNVKLNNNSEDNDVYKNPSFKIVFPKYIEDVEVTNFAVANAEDAFEIKEATIDPNENGQIEINIKLEGEQKAYNSNNITNGTNIIIDTNIKLDIYTPSKEEKITLEYINENATSYKEQTEQGIGYSKAEIEYKAPIGMVSVNKISNYENTGKTVTSVEQGTITDKIDIFDNAKIATMDIIVMNNNDNTCNDVKILGRIPFKGNKDFESGKDLGTTIDTELYGNIISNSSNKVNATIYYSENGDATEDVNDSKNGWTTNLNSIDNPKSYLIIPEEYEMAKGDVLQYSYQYEIPANLEHNTDIYSSFETIYNNKTNVADVKETSNADVVGLTTGVGPQISAKINTNLQGTAKEYEKIGYSIVVENTGSEIANNVAVKVKVPERTTLAKHSVVETVEEAKGWNLKADREFTRNIEQINPGEKVTINFYAQVNKLPTIEEYYANTQGFAKNEDGSYSLKQSYVDENGETKYETTEVSEIPEVSVVCEASISATDLAKEIKISDNGTKIQRSKIIAEETIETQEKVARVNEKIESQIQIKNNSRETMKNIKVTKVLPKGLKYDESYIRGYEADGITLKKINATTYDENTRTITWTIEELNAGRTIILVGEFVVADLDSNTYQATISTISNIKVNNEIYQAGQVDIPVGKPHLEIKQTSNNTNEYVKPGDAIQYIFEVKNTGYATAKNISFVDYLPNEVSIKKLVYVADGVEVIKVVSQNEDATVYTNILPQGSLVVTILVRVNDISEKQKTITNTAKVTSEESGVLESNKLTNIIENIGENKNNTNPERRNAKQEQDEDKNVKTTYEIKGTVWLDNEKDGERTTSENRLSGIQVKLINAETNEKVNETATNMDGEYKFSNLENGKYTAIFYYDSSKYGITEYKKQGVAENVNSDVISATENNSLVAITDVITIKDGSVSGIDMGLINATIFDLSLTKRITKVTVQSSEGSKSYDFNNTDLAKVDINGKYINGAKVFVEYSITITNEGELEGYAKKIVDYMPKELEFSTELNNNWYKGNDGKLYTTQLENVPIAAGESKTVKLVLNKVMTDESTGIINNQAEIAESYNKAGINDRDSEPNNQDQKEDDMSSADLIIGVKTGDALIYISVIISLIITGIAIAIVIKKSKIIYKIEAKFGKEV